MRVQLGNILSTFNKTLNQLDKFTAQCDQDIQTAVERERAAKQEVQLRQSELEQAKRVRTKIEEIVK